MKIIFEDEGDYLKFIEWASKEEPDSNENVKRARELLKETKVKGANDTKG